MAGGAYRGIPAAVPTAQNLRSAFRRGRSKAEARSRSKDRSLVSLDSSYRGWGRL